MAALFSSFFSRIIEKPKKKARAERSPKSSARRALSFGKKSLFNNHFISLMVIDMVIDHALALEDLSRVLFGISIEDTQFVVFSPNMLFEKRNEQDYVQHGFGTLLS